MASSETTKAAAAEPKGGVIGDINKKLAEKQLKDTPPAEPTTETIPPEPKPKRQSGQSVQPPLPNTEEGAPAIPDELKDLLPRVDDAIYQAATWKQTENELKAKVMDLMGRGGMNEVALNSGGKLRYSPGKPKLTYIKPPSKAESDTAAGEDSSEEDDGENEE